jgi:hemolysin activation/secretion protein
MISALRRRVARHAILFALLVPAASPALAQTAPPRPPIPPGLVAPPASPVEKNQPQAQPSIVPPIEQPPAEEIIPEGGATVTVHAVEVDGNTKYSGDELAPEYQSILDKPASVGEIAEAVNRVQLRYRNDGYFLSAARGRFTREPDGVTLHIHVTEGYISDVKIDGETDGGAVKVYDFLSNLLDYRPVNIADMERYLLLAQNVPGMTVRAVLRPTAGESGAVELVAQVARKPFDLFASIDNRGPGTAGPVQLLVSGGANSFTSAGERVQVDLFNTPFDVEQVFGEVSAQWFIGDDGLLVRVYGGYGVNEPGRDLGAERYKGRLDLSGVSALYPIIRSRAFSLDVTGALDIFRSTIDLATSSGPRERQSTSSIRVARVGFDLTGQDTFWGLLPSAANSVDIKFHQGFNGAADEQFPARPGVNNDFEKYTAEIIRVQDLFSLDDYHFALKLAADGQWSHDILPPNEKLFLGGSSYGRGFFSGEVTGDRAVIGTTELQIDTTWPSLVDWAGLSSSDDVPVRYYGFFDAGTIWDREPEAPRGEMKSAGVGIQVAITPEVTTVLEGVNRFTLRPTGSTSVNRETSQAVFFQIRVQY